MARSQKISKAVVFIGLVIFFGACKTPYQQGVRMFESSERDFVLSELESEGIDTLSIDFESLKLSRLPFDSLSVSNQDTLLLSETFKITPDSLRFLDDDPTFIESPVLDYPQPYKQTDTVFSSIFSFPKPVIESDSVLQVNLPHKTDSLTITDTTLAYAENRNMQIQALQDSVQLILHTLKQLEVQLNKHNYSNLSIDLQNDTVQKNTTVLQTDTILKETFSLASHLQDTTITFERTDTVFLQNNPSNMVAKNRPQSGGENIYNTYNTYGRNPAVVSQKDTVFLMETHYQAVDSVQISKAVSQDKPVVLPTDSLRIVFDTIYIVKEVLKPVATGTLNSDSLNQGLITSLNQKDQTIYHLTDSLKKMNLQMVRLQSKTDTVVVEKEKWLTDTLVISEHTIQVDTLKMAVNLSDTLNRVAYYSINQTDANNINEIIKAVNQVDIARIQRISLSGYTDASGSFEINQALTNQRTNKLIKQLVNIGIPESLIFIQNFANRFASNNVIESERRVEVEIISRN